MVDFSQVLGRIEALRRLDRAAIFAVALVRFLIAFFTQRHPVVWASSSDSDAWRLVIVASDNPDSGTQPGRILIVMEEW